MDLYNNVKGFGFDAIVARGDAAYFGIVTMYSMREINQRLGRRGIKSWEEYTLTGVERIEAVQQGQGGSAPNPGSPQQESVAGEGVVKRRDALMMVVVCGKDAKRAYTMLRTLGRLEYVPDLRHRAPMRVVWTVLTIMAFCVVSGLAIWSVFLIGGQL